MSEVPHYYKTQLMLKCETRKPQVLTLRWQHDPIAIHRHSDSGALFERLDIWLWPQHPFTVSLAIYHTYNRQECGSMSHMKAVVNNAISCIRLAKAILREKTVGSDNTKTYISTMTEVTPIVTPPGTPFCGISDVNRSSQLCPMWGAWK